MIKKIFFFFLIPLLFSCEQLQTTEKKKQGEETLEVIVNPLQSPTKNSLRGISILDSNIAWLSGAKGTILRTVNGGNNWELLSPPDNDSLDFRDVEAFSANEAIIINAGSPSRIYRTENGGKSWELVYENTSEAAFMNSIAFKNKNEGIIIGDLLGSRHLLLRSGNGGKNWKRIDSLDVPKPLKSENGFAASGSCIAINRKGNFFIGLGGEQSRIFSSVNGFKWRAKRTPMISGDPASGIYSIASGNEKLMAVGGNYTFPDSAHYPVISLNNGKSWKKAGGKVNGYRSIIDFCAAQKVWVCGGTNGIDLSHDGGESWKQLSSENINTLQFIPNSSKAFAANSKGEILLIEVQLTVK